MNRKQLIALANAIREHNEGFGFGDLTEFKETHLRTLADFCQSTNPRFKRERWLAYIAGQCGPNGGSIK